jgi:DNA-binding response OmpR family regulator
LIKVLVVEKDPSLAWLYREELADAGFTVGVCASLEQARALLSQCRHHVVVTDLGSAGENPDSWLPSLRGFFDGPVVVLSDRPRRRLSHGAASVLPKTSDLAPLIANLRGHAIAARWSAAAGVC